MLSTRSEIVLFLFVCRAEKEVANTAAPVPLESVFLNVGLCARVSSSGQGPEARAYNCNVFQECDTVTLA